MENIKKSSCPDSLQMAQAFLEGAGGKENILSFYNCITRLRIEVRNMEAVDDSKLKEAGAAAVFRPASNQVHIVIGPKVMSVAEEFQKLFR